MLTQFPSRSRLVTTIRTSFHAGGNGEHCVRPRQVRIALNVFCTITCMKSLERIADRHDDLFESMESSEEVAGSMVLLF